MNEDDYLGITFKASSNAADAIITGETSSNLINWIDGTSIHSLSLSEDENHKIITLISNHKIRSSISQQLRLKATLLSED